MGLLRKIVFPVSLVYALVVHIRNYLFDIGVFKSRSFPVPLVCIGNLSVGGTGKTPMVEFLIGLLQDSFKTSVLSRGYRRSSKGFLLAKKGSTVLDLGDEPFQIHCKYPQVTVAVDGNRRRGIQELRKRVKPDVVLLDDAFQHRKVKPHLSFLLTTYDNLYVNDWYLPTGNLRDSKRAAKRADIIVVTKCPGELSLEIAEDILQEIKPLDHQQVLFSKLAYGLPKNKDTTLDWEDMAKEELTIVTGIANPEPFLDYLRTKGLAFEHLNFRDHHSFTTKDLDRIRSKKNILTTEKDYVRLKGKLNHISYVPIKHVFLFNGKEILEERLKRFMKRNL